MRHSEYKIVEWADNESFIDKVNELLERGWSLQGGIAVDGGMFYQALAKNDPGIEVTYEMNHSPIPVGPE